MGNMLHMFYGAVCLPVLSGWCFVCAVFMPVFAELASYLGTIVQMTAKRAVKILNLWGFFNDSQGL